MKPSPLPYRLPFVFLLFIIQTIFSFPATLTDLSIRREKITQQLDSLDLLKQSLKRDGAAITEIELRQTRLRDSLNFLREKIQSATKAPQPSDNKKSADFIRMPSNLFDWIIVVVGGIAFFSGLMLIAGISRSVSSRKRRSAAKKRSVPLQQQPREQDIPQKPKPEYPASPSVSPSPPSGETMTITSLRQRMAASERKTTDNRFTGKENFPPVDQRESVETNTDSPSLEEQVIAAANSGLDTLEISRRFHISVDHVALLLKMTPPSR